MKHILSIIHFVSENTAEKSIEKRGVYAVLCSANNGFGRMLKGEWGSPNIYLDRLRNTTR
jgi:hypothetical protein